MTPIKTGKALPGYHLTEILYEGSRTVVYRGVRLADDKPVVIKFLQQVCPSLVEVLQLRNQYEIVKNLAIPGIVHPYSLEVYGNCHALVMEDFGGISLRQWMESQNWATDRGEETTNHLSEVLTIALQLAEILQDLHQHQIIHKDIKPANILIHPESKQVKLIDFSIASKLPRETQELHNPQGLEGTLAYLSPEQTGRMNRGIDYRSDFYTLGVTLYELLTGQLPFRSDDPMDLVHSHLAELPIAPHEVHPTIPVTISEIVLKLMAKNAEDRYQTTLGLKHDLSACLQQLKTTGTIAPFKIGTRDLCDRFLIPEKLYGREKEVQTLLESFHRVVQGTSELLLVAGVSGIGKTAVVHEVHKPMVQQRGYFIKGKFDQFNRSIPFSAFVQAFRDLMGQLLVESDSQMQRWKMQILAALGDSAQVIIDVIPELAHIVGSQPPAPELSGTAAQNRFNSLFQKFIRVLATADHPLVIFLDDLQWADSASLNLMHLLLREAQAGHFLMIGAYRDNEVFPAHPLILMLDRLSKAGATVNTITLQPLSEHHLNQLVADTLTCSLASAQSLTELIYQNTQGNPFFTTQFLKALHQEGHICFDPHFGHWQTDLTQVRQAALTNDVVEFMAQQLQKQPPETQEILKLAACMGNQFDLSTLVIVAERSPLEVTTALWSALQEGLILPIAETYKFFQEPAPELQTAELNVPYRFFHDRIQQAAYSLIADDQKQVIHLTIGQLWLQNSDAAQQDEHLFDIVNQLNCGISQITDLAQRQQYAQLNLKAGHKAKESTAYSAALDYLNNGIRLLTIHGWTTDPMLMHQLHEKAAEVAFLNFDFEQMESLIQTVLQQSSNLLEQVKVYEIKLQAFQAQNQQLQAIAVGREILQKLGVILPESVTPEAIQQQLEETLEQALNASPKRPIADLVNLPPMQDISASVAARIMISLVPSVHQAAPHLFPIIACEEVKLSLKYGNSAFSAPGYADFGIVASAILNQLEMGYQFGQLALTVLEQYFEKSVQSMVLFKVAAFNQASIGQALDLLKESYQVGLETGDAVHALNSISFRLIYTYLSGTANLNDLLEEIETYQSKFATSQHFLTWMHIVRCSIQSFTTFREKSACLGLNTADEEQFLSLLCHENDELALHLAYLGKLILGYSFESVSTALQDADQGLAYLNAGLGMPSAPIYYYFDSLIRLAAYPTANASEQEKLLAQVQRNQKKLQVYANAAPRNYQHQYSLIEAVKHHTLNHVAEAIELYDRAISEANANANIRDEALANELAGKFYCDWNKPKIAANYMQEAYHTYTRWGATAKAQDLGARYPHLVQSTLNQPVQPLSVLETLTVIDSPQFPNNVFISAHTSSSSNSTNFAFDFAAVLKASQALSSTIKLDELLHQLSQIILKSSGGDRCALILPNLAGEWQVRAIATVSQIDLCTDPLRHHPQVPTKLIQYVKNCQRTVVIDNLVTDLPVVKNYLSLVRPKSVLCMPILNQGDLVGVLYLENRCTAGIFNSERMIVLNFLCTQAAISLQNAQLYQEVHQALQEVHLKEKQYRSIFEAVSDGLAITELETGKLLAANPAYYQMHGYTYEQIMQIDPFECIHPERHAKFLEFLTTVQAQQEFNYSARCFKSDGQLFHVEIRSVPFLYNGQLCALSVMRDITAQKQMEESIQEKNRRLEQAMHDLQRTQLQMVQSEKLASLGNLVAGVAHEINNPIGFLNGSISNAKDYVQDLLTYLALYQQYHPNAAAPVQDKAEDIDLEFLTEDLPKLLNSMQGATERIRSISTSLRTFSRADTEHTVSANLHEGIDSTLLILKYRLKANESRPAIAVIKENIRSVTDRMFSWTTQSSVYEYSGECDRYV